jgi:ABC-2 type transport system permease protein
VINAISPIQCLKFLMQADIRVFIKNKRSLLVSTLLPIFLLFSWDNKATLKTFDGSLFVLAIVVTISIMSLSIFGYTLAVARDREKGIFQRLRVTPAPTWTIMTSRILVQEIANIIIALIVLIIGGRLYHISLNIEDYIFVFLISLRSGAVFLSIGQALAGLIKSADTINAVARLTFIGLMLFGLLGFSGALGPTVKTIANWSPFGTVIRVYDGIPSLGGWSVHTSYALLTCFGYVVVFAAIGIKYFRWEAR